MRSLIILSCFLNISVSCGRNFTTSTGTFQTPNWPETYPNNIDCEWRIELPNSNMLVEISCEEGPFGIAGFLPACDKDFLKFYNGHSKQDTEYGPFCHYTKPETTRMSSNRAMAVFHSGPSHSSSRKGFKCSFRSVAGPTPPPPPPTTPTTTLPPTTITPTVSSLTCGGIISAASGTFQTPNWPETYPNNLDCEWRIQLPESNKVVEISCEEGPFGIAGFLPACDKDFLKFYNGHSKQDTEYGPFCHYTKPETTRMSSNRAMAVFHSGPSHSSSRKGFKCSFQSVAGPTPPPPPPTTPTTTLPPTAITPTISSSTCGGEISAASGTFQTPNWPETYPNNIDCEWRIQLPESNKVVEISCEEGPFGIAGFLPACDKDFLKFYNGHSKQDTEYGPFCQYTKPETTRMSSNRAMAVFHSGPSHSSSRKGFKCSFRSVAGPTPPPPPPTTPTTTLPPTAITPTISSSTCGGVISAASGTFQTPNWPETYPNNIDCEWRIQLPESNKVVEISCEEGPFGIAGFLPACDKDFLKFYNGHSKQDTEYGPFCQYTKPETTRMSSNKAMAVFHSGPSHSSSRKGFKCSFRSVDGSQASQCGGALTAASGSLQSPNWPQTYPVNVHCTWTITLPDSTKRVEINFDSPFGIAGSLPICKDKVYVYDDNTGSHYGPYCFFIVPNPPVMTSNRARVVLEAGPSHSPSRVGFRATYRSV